MERIWSRATRGWREYAPATTDAFPGCVASRDFTLPLDMATEPA